MLLLIFNLQLVIMNTNCLIMDYVALYGVNYLFLYRQEDNVRRMNTSVKLNELIVQRSHDASLVIVNLPAPPQAKGEEENCIL